VQVNSCWKPRSTTSGIYVLKIFFAQAGAKALASQTDANAPYLVWIHSLTDAKASDDFEQKPLFLLVSNALAHPKVGNYPNMNQCFGYHKKKIGRVCLLAN
jgi:hypothetical protein